MNTKKLVFRIVVLAVLLVAVGGTGYWIGHRTADSAAASGPAERIVKYWQAPMDPAEIYDQPGKSKMGMDLVPVYEDQEKSVEAPSEPEILYWQAPMNPSEIYDAPGKSAMGMDLVPVYDDASNLGSGGTILIDPATEQNMGVRTAPVRRMDLSREIRTFGDVSYNEEGLHVINAKISGWIEKLFVNYVGETVRKGEPLLEIYSPELVSTQEEYLLAVRGLQALGPQASESVRQDAARLVDAASQRLEYWDIPQTTIEHLKRTGEAQKTTQLNAPASGVVIDRMVVPGAYIKPGMDLFRIADLSTVWVHASFYDNELPWIAVGQSVSMELSYLPGKTYQGHIDYIYPFLREKARDVHVRLVFNNSADFDLKPGMYANLRLDGKPIPNAVVIPTEAIIRSGERSVAFVSHGGGRFEPREILTGEQGGPGNNLVRVLDGLLENEQVVVSAQFMIDSESRLQEAIEKMLAGRNAAPSGEAGKQPPPTDHSQMDHSQMDSPSVVAPAMPDTSHSGHRP
ncbi:MAG: RND family efflux transporter MFP subunit [Rhodothermales bacterium]|jgi:RND family efflux transporter MFP subunit